MGQKLEPDVGETRGGWGVLTFRSNRDAADAYSKCAHPSCHCSDAQISMMFCLDVYSSQVLVESHACPSMMRDKCMSLARFL